MRFSAERDALAAAFAALGCVQQAKTVIPILSHIRIDAEPGKITLATHNLDQCASATVAADVSEEGSACIPFGPLDGLISGSAKGSHVKVEVVNGVFEKAGTAATLATRVNVAIGRSRYSLGILPPEDFPPQLRPIEPFTFSVPAEAFSSLLESTSYAINTDKPLAHEVALFVFGRDVPNSQLRQLGALATKGASVAMAWLPEPMELHLPVWKSTRSDDKDEPGFFLSREVVGHVRKIAQNGTLQVSVGKNAVSIQTEDGITYAAKLIESTAPNYRRIPAPPATAATVSRDDILSALARLVSVLPNGLSRAIKLDWKDGGTLNIMLGGEQTGTEELDGQMVGDREFACNILFLQEAITRMPSKDIRICAGGPGEPVHVLSPSEPNRHAIIMPMRW